MAVFIISHSHMIRDMLMTTCKLRDFDVVGSFENSSALTQMDKNAVVVLHTGRNLEDVERQVSHLHNLCRDVRIMLIVPSSAIKSIRAQFITRVYAIMPEDNPTDALIGALAVVSKGYCVVALRPEAIAGNVQHRKSPVRNETKVYAAPQSWKTHKASSPLSPRENAVLEKLLDGGSNKDIANALGICEATVKVYLRTCFQKIGVKNRTQAAVWASERL